MRSSTAVRLPTLKTRSRHLPDFGSDAPCTKRSTGCRASLSSSTPDPNFYFGSKQHRRAKAYLDYGVSRNEGFIVITGEVGRRQDHAAAGTDRRAARHQRRRRPPGHHATRCRGHAAHGGRRVRLPGQGCAEVRAADHARGVPDQPDQQRQALPADHRRGAEPHAARRRRTAHAVELPVRQPGPLQSFLVGQPEFREILSGPKWSSSASASRPPATSARWTRKRPSATSSTASSAPVPQASPASRPRPSRPSKATGGIPGESTRCATGCCCWGSWPARRTWPRRCQ